MDAKQALAVAAATPGDVDRLRQLILSFAVRGLLVPQDPNDEPASVLLEQIRVEKIRLTKEGKIRKEKPLPSVSEDEKPFELPNGWAYARFLELGEFGRGKSKHRPRNDPVLFNPGKYPLIQTGDVARANWVIENYNARYSEFGLSQSKLWPSGTLCITIAANIADSAILTFDSCFPDSVVGFIPSPVFRDAKYFLYFVKTAREKLLEFAPATAQKNINLDILNSVLIPLPPLQEQFRIVERVEELMAICDSIEANNNLSEECHANLVGAALEALAESCSPEEAASNWRRVVENFPLLLDRPDAVNALENSVLSLAVRGLLVPQDPKDEPASVLVEKIRAEKACLVKEGKIRKDKPLPEVSEDEKPFPVPEGWEWVRMGDILPFKIGKTPPSKDSRYWSNSGGFNWVSIADMPHFGTVSATKKFLTKEGAEVFGYDPLPAGTLLMSFKLTIGKVATLSVPAYHNEAIVSLMPLSDLSTKYLMYFLPFFASNGESKDALMGATLNSDSLSVMLLAIPPVAEQSRIVARVEELMRLCDDLRSSLTLTAECRTNLVRSIVDTLAEQV